MNDPDDLSGDFEEGPTIRGLRTGDEVLGRFTLEHCLGRGGMGEVWLAKDGTLNERIALKLLPRMIHFDAQAVEDLKNETKRGRQLSHPSVVRVFDFYQDEENSGIAMEYVEGDNLSALLSKAPNRAFTVTDISEWVTEFLHGLDYAHESAQVIHRDLKPSNLLIQSDSQHLKIADFGIARCVADSMERVTVSAQNRGTLCYMSPEQVSGRGVNKLDDIYAVGATLYELLAGTPPFYTGDVFSQVLKVPPTPIVERQRERGFIQPPPSNWEAAIIQCLAKDRSDRPEGAAALLEMLELGSGRFTKKRTKRQSSKSDSASKSIDAPAIRLTDDARTTTPSAPELTVESSALIQTADTNVQRATFDLTRPEVEDAPEPTTPKVALGRRRKKKSNALPVFLGLGVLLAGGAAAAFHFLGDKTKPGEENSGPGIRQLAGTNGSKPQGTGNSGGTSDNGGNSGGTASGGGNGEEKDPPPPPIPPNKNELSVPGDFATIQAAIDGAKVGQTILVGSGEFRERLILKEGVILRGAGSAETIVRTDGRGGSTISASRVNGITIESIGFFHDGDQVFASGHPVGSFIECDNLTITDCAFRSGIKHGLHLSGKGKSNLSKCRFEDNTESGLWVESGAVAAVNDCQAVLNKAGASVRDDGSTCKILSSRFLQNLTHGLEVSDQAKVDVSGKSFFSDNGHCGILAVDSGTTASLGDTEFVANKTGIAVREKAKGTLFNLDFKNNEVGVEFQNPGDSSINGSTIHNGVLEGIACDASSESGTVTIEDNDITYCAKFGLVIIGGKSNPTVTNNRFGPNGHGDAIVSQSAKATFTGNTFKSKKDVIVEPPAAATIDDTNTHQPEA